MSRKKDGQTIQTNIYISTFNTPKIPKELKISYTTAKVETYLPICSDAITVRNFAMAKRDAQEPQGV